MSAVVLESVHKIFKPAGFTVGRHRRIETHALRDVSFSVSQGEVLALLGPNGSGKSTTLKLISTVLLPDSGSVRLNGANTRKDAAQVRKHVGFALASERSFFPRLTARENLDFFATLEDVPRSDLRERVALSLRTADLEEHADKQVMKFSSGMHQRLAIARALVKQPRVLLLDEPTRSLDPAGANRLWDLIRELAATGMTVILATHNFSEAGAVADRVAVLQRGSLLDVFVCGNLAIEQLQTRYLEITGEAIPAWQEGVPA